MSIDIRSHFQQTYNKRRIHIESLRSTRDDKQTTDKTRRLLNKKITYERQQLAVLDEIWNVD